MNWFHSFLFYSPQAAPRSSSMDVPDVMNVDDVMDDYNVEEEDLNMFQAQRMVQKAIHRTKKK